ncbi:Anaphase-promoting complex subunit 1 [Coemansia sp. RSA 1821]|nr:Anaphase-promoting complex subunit 1 [Coemansia sp. RSA 1821]
MDRRPRLVAVLDDTATGCHRAQLHNTTISWSVNGRFVRSFRMSETKPTIEDVLFARFATEPNVPVVSLCIFGIDTLNIYYYSGESFLVALPFAVARVCSLQQGLLVQRQATESLVFGSSLPSLFSLQSPRSEFTMLGLGHLPDMDRVTRNQHVMLSPTPSRATSGAIPVFNDPNIELLDTASSRSGGSAQYVLCWDSSARRHLVYQCIVIDQPADSADYTGDPDPSLSQFSGISQLSSASRPRMARQTSLSVQRRTSAAPPIGPLAAAASRRKSGFTSAVKNDRRSSIMFGRVSFNDSPAPSYAADIFYEQRQMRAQVVLQLCWTERRQRDEPCADARICVVQSVVGSNVLCLMAGGTVVTLDAAFEEIMRCPAASMAPVRATRPDMDDLLLVSSAGNLQLAPGGTIKPLPLQRNYPPNILRVVYTQGSKVALETSGHTAEVSVQVPILPLARSLVASLSFVLSQTAYPLLWRAAIALFMHCKAQDDQVGRLLSLLLHGSDKRVASAALPARVKAELRDRASAVLFAFRMVYEDTALQKSETFEHLSALGQFMLQFSLHTGQTRVHQALVRAGMVPAATVDAVGISVKTRQRSADSDAAVVPSLTKWALSAADSQMQSFPTLDHIGNLFGITDAEPAAGARDSTKLLNITSNMLYQLMIERDTALVLRQLANDKNPMRLICQLSTDMQWLVHSVIETMKLRCISSWPLSVLALIGRHDMIANTNENFDGNDLATSGQAYESALGGVSTSTEPKSITELCEQVLESSRTETETWEQSSKAQEFSTVAFSRDLRLEEVERLLNMRAPTFTAISLGESSDPDDPNGPRLQFLTHLAQRVLALPLSQALLRYSSQQLKPQSSLPIIYPKVAARFRGHKTDITWTPGEAEMNWPLFHSGVAAALSVERDQLCSVHSSWVLLNWPSEPDDSNDSTGSAAREFDAAMASHAGFLLGMGLLSVDKSESSEGSASKQDAGRGPLCNMPPWQAFKYLSKRHGLTSIALLLGCACAHRGTMNSSVSKILSLHIPNLLPPGSSELMLLSYGTQASALLGLGLLYMQSQNRRMVEVMLHELEITQGEARDSSNRLENSDPAESTAECYSLSAGFALGLVAIGCGQSTQSLADLKLLDALSALVSESYGTASISMRTRVSTNRDSSQQETVLNDFADMDISAEREMVSDLGPIAAIGLVFLGTNYNLAAQRLSLPRSIPHLRVLDPFVVMWKLLMQSLIMLEDIQPTLEWIESRIPAACTQDPAADNEELTSDLLRIRLHAVAAVCFAMALKYAGSENAAAHAAILHHFDALATVAAKPSLSYESSLTKAAAQSCLDIMCISASLVVAGSGDISTMKRLRSLHSATGSRLYGNHMASHMALGLLFIGGGAQFTISNSTASIALLTIAFFPRFPQHYTDNNEHLQAWRHLWALCVVPRCLVVRDVSTGKMCKDAVVVLGNKRAVSPLLFPLLEDTSAIQVDAPGYIPLKLDIATNSHARELLSRRRVLYLQPMQNAQDLADLSQYKEWLAATLHSVEQLIQTWHSADPARTISTIQSVQRLRIYVRVSRSSSLLPNAHDSSALALTNNGNWAESTFLTWLAVRKHVLGLGQLDQCRRLLTRYWTGSVSEADEPQSYTLIALLYATLDLPSPADAMAIAKQEIKTVKEFKEYFEPKLTVQHTKDEVLERLCHLTQTGSVSEYVIKEARIAGKCEMDDDERCYSFIQGLQQEPREYVRKREANGFMDVAATALRYERLSDN